ncbi:MAG: glutamine--fructose-6-phosphate transaminase (isomerizing) [Rickettsiales bacterium]|jgi:glucosamine--fructose-6-phosphate aminotransferase (isomerizing)|nr:glutamine--fructose-6-phosphate transaminase (isomerizing) [Rickettsiales bacterium]
MCGIIGYCGRRNTREVLLAGLKRLEYRGYDSSGIAVGIKDGVSDASLAVVRRVGKLNNLFDAVAKTDWMHDAGFGIGHTRWATHGEVSEANSHPHTDCTGKIAIVHNGIIENYQRLKDRLSAAGHKFKSETDSEVIAHLLEESWDGDLVTSMQTILPMLRGTYGIIAMHSSAPGALCGVRNGSPLVLGIGKGETFLASDVGALAGHAESVVYLDDGEIVSMNADGFNIIGKDFNAVEKKRHVVDVDDADFEKNGFAHFMLKEIFEQPESIARGMAGRLDIAGATGKLGGLNMDDDALRAIHRVIIIGAGTSYFAAGIGAHLLGSVAGVSARAELSSEVVCGDVVVEPRTLYFAVSQSGETADTLSALRELKRKGARVLGICNTVGSTIARETDGGVYIHSGPEIAVASTKAFTSQITILAIFTLIMARLRSMTDAQGKEFICALRSIPGKIREILSKDPEIKALAEKYSKRSNFMFLGRGICLPAAYEGALKLKEISYIHAEGIAAGELKHGPISLIDEKMPCLFLVPNDAFIEKNISNMKEVKARKGKIIAVSTVGNPDVATVADDVIEVPQIMPVLAPFLMIIPIQLFAYHSAVLLGRDVDQPRNLAKSVTVE